MSFQKNIFIALAAFGLGFYASEYRHAQQPQPLVHLPAVENPVSRVQTSVHAPVQKLRLLQTMLHRH